MLGCYIGVAEDELKKCGYSKDGENKRLLENKIIAC